MLLGFKRRFAPFVEEGSKTHTIRSIRKNVPKVGQVCHCYVNPRQKTMRLLGRWRCVKVEEIEIYERGDGTFGVVIDGDELTPDEKDALAWRDGFRGAGLQQPGAFVEMIMYWTQGDYTIEVNRVNHKPGEPFSRRDGLPALAFHGHIIHWDYRQPVKAIPAAVTSPRRPRRKAALRALAAEVPERSRTTQQDRGARE